MSKPHSNADKMRSGESAEAPRSSRVEQPISAPDASSEVRSALGTLEAVSGEEGGVETGVGKVSERDEGGKEKKGDFAHAQSSKSSAKARDDEASRKQALIDSKPSKDLMLNQIKRHFRAEQQELLADLSKYRNEGDWYRYNGNVARLRQICDYLGRMVHFTYDALKTAWLKMVHGIG